jgi:anti-sigma regulatory factor (Ser/Thr protein kinase)
MALLDSIQAQALSSAYPHANGCYIYDFLLKNLDETASLCEHIARLYPQPSYAALGISELLINAIEHGNLGIGYHRKTTLLHDGSWLQEIRRRQLLPENRHKTVRVHFVRYSRLIALTISNDGDGFDWQKYTALTTRNSSRANGRGIALARASFDHMEYLGNGNTVMCVASL